MTPEDRRAAKRHLERLARRYGIQVNWRNSRSWVQFEAHVGTRTIWVREPRSTLDYLAALHEMGHLISPHAHLAAQHYHGPMEEAAAWEWAMKRLPTRLRRELGEHHWRLIGRAWASSLPGGTW